MKEQKHNSVESVEEYNRVHQIRWQMSIAWIKNHIPVGSEWSVLEISHRSHLSELFKGAVGIDPHNTFFDVRDPKEWGKMRPDKYDLVLNTEVIEHLPDWNPEGSSTEDYIHRTGEFKKTGVMNCLSGCLRVLKPGGYMFLTTPNASSVMVLANWIYSSAPFNWDLHVREFGFQEAIGIVTAAGFEIVKVRSEDPYVHVKEASKLKYYDGLMNAMRALSIPTENRGETTFMVLRKKA